MGSPRGKEVSNLKWGYVIVFCKATMAFLGSGVAKSVGFLIPEIVDHLDASYASVGLVCGLPGSIMMLAGPVITFILVGYNHRLVAMFGGITCAVCLGACAFAPSTIVFGLCLAFSGIGRACVFHASTLLINDYFPEKFLLMNTLSLYGSMFGIMVLPIIADRSLEAYGYSWTFLILGAIKLHVVACATALRRPFSKDIAITKRKDSTNESMTLIEAGMSKSKGDQRVEAMIIEVKARERNTDICERNLIDKTERSGQEVHPTDHVQKNNPSLKESDSINKDAIEFVEKNETDSDINAEERKTLFLGNDGIDIHKPFGASDSEDRSGTFCSSRSIWESGSIEKVDATELGGGNGSDTGSAAEERKALILENGETGNILQPSAASDANRNEDSRGIFGSFRSTLEHYWKPILQEHVFLVTLPVVLLHTYVINAWVFFLVPHAEQVGIIQSRAVLLATIVGIAGVIGRTIAVVLLAKVAKQTDMIPVYIITSAMCSVTFLLDGFGDDFVTRACLAFVQGVCFFTMDTSSFLKIALMREDNFSTAYGINCAVFAVGLIASGLVTGALFDVLHSYTKIFNILGVIEVLCVANIFLIKVLLKGRLSSGKAE